jgi:hypothetical protein
VTTTTTLAEQIDELLEQHINRCRRGVAACPKWSPAQAEWSRARDALLNFQDDLIALRPRSQDNGHAD